MNYILYFILTIFILVLVHEFGHFAAAKLCGMRADIFSIGFGKRLLGWNKLTGFVLGDLPKDFDGQGNTDYRLSLLPLGGYVKIAGMVDESFDTDFIDKEPKPYEFRSKPAWKKIIVISAGVFMNLLLALLVFSAVSLFQGRAITKTTTVGFVPPHSLADSLGFKSDDKILTINGKQVNSWEDVRSGLLLNAIGQNLNIELLQEGIIKSIKVPRSRIPGDEDLLIPSGVKPVIGDVVAESPALKAGFKPGDILLAINDIPLYNEQEVIQIISKHKNIQISATVLRVKDTLNLKVTPSSVGIIGVHLGQVFTGQTEFESIGFFDSFNFGVKNIITITELTYQMLGNVITGKIAFGKAIGGPVKIAQYAVKFADNGLLSFLSFLGMLSLTLAIINIFPFPVLDGGHLLIIIIEGIARREIPIKVKIAIQNAGFVIILLLMAFIIYNDLINL